MVTPPQPTHTHTPPNSHNQPTPTPTSTPHTLKHTGFGGDITSKGILDFVDSGKNLILTGTYVRGDNKLIIS